MHQVWDTVKGNLKNKLDTQEFEIWIEPIRLTDVNSKHACMSVPNPVYRDYVDENYGKAIADELGQVLGFPVTLTYEFTEHPRNADTQAVAEPHEGSSRAHAVASTPGPHPPDGSVYGVLPDKTFDNFVVGACNQFAHAAALAAAETPGQWQYNPLYIHGGTGLGKTHLLHAIGNLVRRRDPSARVLYVSSERFTNDLIDSFRFKSTAEFRERYRNYPTVLLMDDVQFLSGKDRTQEELFHTFECLREQGRQIVFTSDVLPREIQKFQPRLRTRCENGMIADIQPPDMETLVAIVHQKAVDQDFEVPGDVAQFIASRVHGNIREVEGALHRLRAMSQLYRTPPTLDFAREHLGKLLGEPVRALSPDEIIQTVADFYNQKVSDLTGTRRFKYLVRPRHVAMWLVRKHVRMSFPEIGRFFGHRDHATVQHACRKISRELQKDADLRSTIEMLEQSLGR